MQRRCTRFTQWIDNTGLIDLGFSGPKFTWARGLSPTTRKEARLGRALCNIDWRVKFQDGVVRHLLKAVSDHSPLLISTGGFPHSTTVSKPFRFQVAWATHNQFTDVVETCWRSASPLVLKLSELAAALTKWNSGGFWQLIPSKAATLGST